MAQGGRKKPQVSSKASGGSNAKKKGKGGAGKSIAAARSTHGNRNQLLIGGAALIVIIAIIAVGVTLTAKKTAKQGSGYGVSTATTASVADDGIITVSNGSSDLVLDIYEDALCPACAQFEHQFGDQVAQALDQGDLTVRYRMVDFLNGYSHSGDYSTRAFAALLAVAKVDGDQPGVFMKFHTALYDPDNQPKEHGSSDLSNAELASLAGANGASEEAQKEISDGAEVDAAKTAAQSNIKGMDDASAKAGVGAGTPTVAKDGVRISTADVDWLKNLLPAGALDSGESGPSSEG